MKREGQYDLLRVIATYAVIALHVSWDYCNYGMEKVLPLSYFRIGCIWASITRFAVPCFLMISGAFLLSNEKNVDWKNFYVKSWRKLGRPLMVISVIYVLYYYARNVLYIIAKRRENVSWIEPIWNWMKGIPGKHLWYMYMLIGLYICVPWLIRVKKEVSRKQWICVSIIFVVLGIISNYTSTYCINWGFESIRYIGYLMIGNCIYENKKYNTNNKFRTILAFAFGIIGFLILGVAYYYIRINSIESLYEIVDPLSPFVIILSSLIFYGFVNIELKKNYSKR